MPGVLSGVRVVDLGHYVAGPLAAVLLADHGADVVRIDRPGQDDAGDPAGAFLHRGKRRITLDLKNPGDLGIARELIARSDVLVENFRPGVMDRLGLGPAVLAAATPSLVYCSLPGFGTDDPRAAMPGWEGVIAAATGNCRVRHGEAPADWDMDRPTYSALPMASNVAAFLAAYSIISALTRRHRTGRGERIEVPLFNAMFELIGGAGSFVADRGPRPERPLDRMGSGTYRCGDGRYVQFNPIGASARFLGWFLDAAGESAWSAEGLTSLARIAGEPRVAAELKRRLTELFLRRPAAEWEDLANAAGVPLCMIRTTGEWAATEHAQAAEQVVRADDPVLGQVWIAGRPVRMSTAHAELGGRHGVDADRAEILAELAQPAPARPVLPAVGDELPYHGKKVVDLTQILAGPSAGRMLAEFGADVVKINSPQRKIDAHGFVNRGKRTVLLDLESQQGQEVLWALLADADVVTQNFPRRTADRYGLGYEHIRARRPDIVYVSVSCYGAGGPWESRRGYETQGQASTGIMERAGRDGKPGVLGPYNLLDYGTGAVAALAAALGLYHRTVTGEGQHVMTSLSQVGVLHQATLLIEHVGGGSAIPDGPAGRWALGVGAWQRFYRANDGWFFFGATPADHAAIAALPGLGALGEVDPSDEEGCIAALAKAFEAGPVGHWTRLLREAGFGVHRIVRLPELMADPAVVAQGLSVRQVTEEAGQVVMPGPAVRLANQTISAGYPARRPGADAARVLAGVGLADDIKRLERSWVLQVSALPPGWEGF
ncbi:CaiB/BaiF CoA transferase family protein [Rhizomonospora bruguierae]|uniref:CaiB/BaiF CoA transferase family protein n=1 Tax=Rhizomonospora bruguierae TaxID=1581705 RepID=UPI001BCDF1FA|nr:CoA transferase [Micromonospora sp. NBRC 107566]